MVASTQASSATAIAAAATTAAVVATTATAVPAAGNKAGQNKPGKNFTRSAAAQCRAATRVPLDSQLQLRYDSMLAANTMQLLQDLSTRL